MIKRDREVINSVINSLDYLSKHNRNLNKKQEIAINLSMELLLDLINYNITGYKDLKKDKSELDDYMHKVLKY